MLGFPRSSPIDVGFVHRCNESQMSALPQNSRPEESSANNPKLAVYHATKRYRFNSKARILKVSNIMTIRPNLH